MRIVKAGSVKWWVGREATCPVCGTVFELEEIDELDETDPGSEDAVGEFQCMVCDHTVTLPRSART